MTIPVPVAARILLAAALMQVPAFSQNPLAGSVVRGEIRTAGPIPGDLIARLVDVSGGRLPPQAIVAADGAFAFPEVAPGSYRFQLVRLPDQVLIEELVQIPGPGEPLRFELPRQASTSYSGAPKISARQLRHPPSKAAVRAFAEAKRDSEAGNHAKAIVELRRAVVQSPEYGQAWSNLGVQYLRSGQTEAAILALEEAARLMPDEALIHTNLSYAYSLASRWDLAESEARRALQLDRNYVKAHIVLAKYYLRSGQKAAAEQELRAYVAGAEGDDKAKAERWLAELSLVPRP